MANSFLQLLTIHLIPNTLSIYIYREIKLALFPNRVIVEKKLKKEVKQYKS